MEEYKKETPMGSQISSQMSNVEEDIMSEEDIAKIEHYNKNVFTSVTDDYKKIKPLTDILVRVKVNEPRVSDSGLIASNKIYIPVPTKSGVGSLYVVENPYPYSKVAVVIAKPDSITSLDVGDVVLLSNTPVSGDVKNNGKDAVVEIPKAFVHPNSKLFRVPTDMTNEHYGYLFIPYYEIQMVLEKS